MTQAEGTEADTAGTTGEGARSPDAASKIGEGLNAAIAEVVAMFLRVPQTAGWFLFRPVRAVERMDAELGTTLVRPYTFLGVGAVLFNLAMQPEVHAGRFRETGARLIEVMRSEVFESFSVTGLLVKALPIVLAAAATAWLAARIAGEPQLRKLLLYVFGVQAAGALLVLVAVFALGPLASALLGGDDILFWLYPVATILFLFQVNRAALHLHPERQGVPRLALVGLVSVAYFVPLTASTWVVAVGEEMARRIDPGPPQPELHLVRIEAFEAEPALISARVTALIVNPTERHVFVEPRALTLGVFWYNRDVSCSARERRSQRCSALMWDPGTLHLLDDVTLFVEGEETDLIVVDGGANQVLTIEAQGGEAIAHMAERGVEPTPLAELKESHRPWLSLQFAGDGLFMESLWAAAEPTRTRGRTMWRAPTDGGGSITYHR